MTNLHIHNLQRQNTKDSWQGQVCLSTNDQLAVVCMPAFVLSNQTNENIHTPYTGMT